MNYAEIIFQQKVGFEKETLTYKIPSSLDIKVGQSVEITLRNKAKAGLVWKIHDEKPKFQTKAISEIIRERPLLTKSQIKLIEWMSKYYFCPIFKVLKLFIPKRVFENKPFRDRKKKDEQIISASTKELTEAQQKAIDTIRGDSSNNFLIHGITGSGKTEIYTQLAKSLIEKEKQVLMLVPEISLTPQIIEYFESSLNIKAAVIHSKLSPGERYKSWINIWKNQAKLIIGSRSCLFSPFQNLGMIIIDEEHENSYKQDNSPRYHVHQVIKKMQNLDKELKAVYGSATPSIETAEKLSATTIKLDERIGKSSLPSIEIVDLRDEFKKHNYSIFSDRLRQEITDCLSKKEQVLLFLNRRGSASSVVCRDCGHAEKCKNCDITMTYHAYTLLTPKLICHHCGVISSPPTTCPDCKGLNIRYLGIGTQKIESEAKKEFPNAKVLRADKDTTSTKHGFEKIYKAFRNHEADILVGTQMIAKGLHLPKVNLVGVILSDIGLNIPDFRSSERIFQLMTQVSGRAGRSSGDGKVIIQTYNPESIVLSQIKNQSYAEFFKYERTQRSILSNPPFSRLAKILIQEDSLDKAKQLAEKITEKLNSIASNNPNFEINQYPAYITKLRNKYQYIVLIKDKGQNEDAKGLTFSEIHKTLEKLPKEYIMSPNIKIDIDPISTT